jgi:hypothetical protein
MKKNLKKFHKNTKQLLSRYLAIVQVYYSILSRLINRL